MDTEDKKTAWRKLLDEDQEWRKCNWMDAPDMYSHVAQLMGNVNWIEHARDTHLIPLQKKLYQLDNKHDKRLKLLSVGCGSGTIERECLIQDWPVASLHCLEYDTELLKAAENNLAEFDCQKTFSFFDMNDCLSVSFGTFDAVFFCHSMHHCTNFEDLMNFIQRSLHPEGIVFGADYFGPARFQVGYETLILLKDIFRCLPERLRLDLGTMEIDVEYSPPLLQSVIGHDPTEAPRSADIRGLFFSNFPVIDYRPMGGTLLRFLLSNRSGNYRNADDRHILNLLQFIERTLIRYGSIQSDDLFFVCKRSLRL